MTVSSGDRRDSLFRLFDSCEDVVLVLDPESGKILDKNRACQIFLGRAPNAPASSDQIADVLPAFATAEALDQLSELAAGTTCQGRLDIAVAVQNGESRRTTAVLQRIDYAGQPAIGVVLKSPDCSILNVPAAQRRDPLTNLPDRSALQQRLEILLAGERSSDLRFAILFIDLNDFKLVNDQWGHLVGDSLISEVAGRLAECVRDGDTLVRYGGDEFVALLEGAQGPGDYMAVVQRMHEVLSEPYTLPSGNTTTISASIGAVDSSEPWRTPQELIHAADQAMYHAKRLPSPTS